MRNLNPLYLNEGAIGATNNFLAANKLLSRAGVVAAHFGNNMLKVKKILDAFPNPESLKNYLMRLSNPNARKLGEIMNPNMDYNEYTNFIKRNFSDKFNFAHLISGRIGLGLQAARGLKNGVSDGSEIVQNVASQSGFGLQ